MKLHLLQKIHLCFPSCSCFHTQVFCVSLISKHHHLGMAVSLGGHMIHGVIAAASMCLPGKFLS